MKSLFRLILLFTSLLYSVHTHDGHKPVVTIITGLWDVKRGQMQSQFANMKRSFDYYLGFFAQMLQTNANLIIFGDEQLQKFVRAHRDKPNTLFVRKDLSWVKSQWYTPKMKKVIDHHKNIPEHAFYNQYVQFQCELYNPVLFSKLFMMTEALAYDPFHSDYFAWMDAGLIHVEDKSLFVPTNVLEKLPIYFQGPWVHHSVNGNGQMRHGFNNEGRRYIKNNSITNFVWGGYYGGRVQALPTVRNIFENIVRITLEQNQMWTEQNIYSIMVQRYPYMISYVHNLELKHLSSITFNNMHHPPPIDTQRYIEFTTNTISHATNVKTTVQTREIIVNNLEELVLLKGRLATQEKLNNFNEKLIANLESEMAKEIIIEGVVLVFFIGVYLALKFGLSDIKSWLQHRKIAPRI